ncbi:MAG: ATP-binding cassette domain-containing protein [Treponema sp.]|jgi:ABC-2 type transport system ATP-binding protein|nr:ATP-binding cassette domain-containing protein [Treponema sp.]
MIEVENISKSYGSLQAVKDLSFTVAKDQVLGFLGPNGAGKTTIMKILTGYHFPSGGTARVEGYSVEDDPVEVKKRTGYLPESVPLYADMTVEEYLSFMAAARLVPADRQKDALERSVAGCGLRGVRSKPIETLSKGYKQRVGLAQAIIHDPPVLILDEPTSGLDPNQIIEIRSLIKELGRSKTVILSTHILQEVEAVCSRVLILNEGRVAAQGTPEEIAGTLKGGDTWEIVLKAPGGTGNAVMAEKCSRLASLAGRERTAGIGSPHEDGEVAPVLAEKDGLWELRFFLPAGRDTKTGPQAGEGIFNWAVAEGLKILGMNRRKLSLEDIFVKLTSEQAGPSGTPLP